MTKIDEVLTSLPVDGNWYVYLLRCQDNALYCGITTNPVRRLARHLRGNTKSVVMHGGAHMYVYLASFGNHKIAAREERRIKSLALRAKWALLAKEDNLLKGCHELFSF